MKKVVKHNKIFKIIPEAKLVIGEAMGECPANIYKEFSETGITEEERYVIRAAWSILGMDIFDHPLRANAYCDERDEFDEKIGVEVAASKVDLKKHRKMANKYSRLYFLLNKAASTVYKLFLKHCEKANAIETDLENYYGRLSL